MTLDRTTQPAAVVERPLRLETLAGNPARAGDLLALDARGWPEFIHHDAVSERCWLLLGEVAPQLQFVLVDEGTGEVVAGGHAVPFAWDGTVEGLPAGWDDVLDVGTSAGADALPNAVSALSIVIRPENRGQGLSRVALRAMRDLVVDDGYDDLLAPVRPSHKHIYPLIPMGDYIAWRRPDGRPFDPWLRMHTDVGAEVLQVAEASMVVEGTTGEWESWTDITVVGSGLYLVPEALVPVEFDRDRDHGCYVEPNVWVRHRLRDDRR